MSLFGKLIPERREAVDDGALCSNFNQASVVPDVVGDCCQLWMRCPCQLYRATAVGKVLEGEDQRQETGEVPKTREAPVEGSGGLRLPLGGNGVL